METACNESMRMGIKNFAAGDGTVPQSVLIFDAILSASPDFHYIFDLQHRFTYANPSLLKLWGKTLGEVVGKNFEDLGYPPELVKLHEKQLNEALLGNTVRGENSYTNHEGKTGYYEYIFVPIFDKSGKIQAISGTTRDITERRHREEVKVQEQRHVHHIEQIKNNERILDQIFFESPAFMTFMSGPEHIYERANKKFYEFTGLNSSILGKKVVDVFPEHKNSEILSRLNLVFQTGDPYIGNEVPIKLDGTKNSGPERYLDVVYQAMRGTDGSIYGVVVQGFDVTEKVVARKILEKSKETIENERKNFQNLFKQTPEMVCILDGPKHVFQFVNEAHVRALGFDATGMAVRVAQPESVEVHGILDRVYETGETAELHEIPVTVSGRLRYFNLTYAAKRNLEGQINGVMILGVEVTDQVQAREQLKAAVSSRDEFMSIASHELKTPLTSLQLQVQIRKRDLARGKLDRFSVEQLPRLLADDERQIKRLTRLVDDMLDISRLQTGKLSYFKEKFDFKEMIHDLLSRFSSQIEAQGCEVFFNSEITVTGYWDRFRIEQAIVNLLTNALKYGAGKPIHIDLKLKADKILLSIADQGMGIAPKDQSRIFEQFERAVDANSISGLGLGLYISKKIIESHGGKISVESELGKGAKFIVELPLATTAH